MLTVTTIDACNGASDWLDNLLRPTSWLHTIYRVVPRALLRRLVLPDATTGIWCAYLDFTNEREAKQAAESMSGNIYAVNIIRY